MMKQFILTLMMVAGPFQRGFAHEGHDKTPGAMAAPHGGVIIGTSQLYLELVSESGGVKIYPLTHDTASIPTKEVALQGSITFPKKPKAVPIAFVQNETHFSAKVDAKGAYRYFLDIVVTYKGKKDKVRFQVEPQS